MTGRKLGNYEVLDKLGEGGMGEVWRARDSRLNRTVAVKVLPADVAGDPARRQRFEQEARALAALNHPNIVAVYDVGQSEGRAYIVSELVEGESLRKIIDQGPLAPRRLIDIAVQTAEALAAAHALGIVHRDLKPENIMVSGSGSGSSGRVKVLDFGLAKQAASTGNTDDTATIMLSQPGMVLGTVGYMSPEQVRAESVDARSDIFSFGCILYEMATARHAFGGKTAADVISAVLKEEPAEISGTGAQVPQALEAIARRCLEKDPAQRFQSAADLAFALRAISSASPSQSGSLLGAPAVPKRRKWLVPAAAVLGSIAVFAGGFALHARLAVPVVPRFHRVTFREGSVSAARFSPDWQDVVYTADWDSGPSRIYQSHPGSPESRDLELSDSRLLAVSSKGDLAILQGPFTPEGLGTLARSSISGGQARQLLENVGLADWSPDASEMAIVRAVEGKYRVEYPVGKVLVEYPFPPFALRISPDGQRVAFTQFTMGTRIGLFVVDRGGTVVKLGPISGQVSDLDVAPLAWTPDGREIWVRSYDSSELNTIYAVNLGGNHRVVARFPGRVTLFEIAADGRVLLSTESGRKGIRGLAPGGEMDRDLSCMDSSRLRGLSADGSLIVGDVLGESGGPKGSIYMRRTDGSAPVRLGDGVAYGLSPDGKWIAGFSSRDTGNRMFELMPTGPGETIRSRMIVGWLSGQGNYLVFEKAPSGKGMRYQAWDSASNVSRSVSPDGMPDTDEHPPVSPDGRRFLTVGPDGQHHIYSIDGGEPKMVVGLTPHDRVVGWTADGRSVYITTHHNQNRTLPVSVLDLEKGTRTPWKEIKPTVPVDEVSGLRITPDGKAYAYNYTYLRSELYVADGIR
ncbi:MAG TPA: protein kinase [Bryobacteraceae bacterium]|nr:protein kinase [Bryobacteraceae bacterium]